MELVFLGSFFMRLDSKEGCAETRTAMLSPCRTLNTACCVAPLLQPQDPAPSPAESRRQLTGSAPPAEQWALFSIRDFLPATKSEQPVQTKKIETLRNNHIYCAHWMCLRKLFQSPWRCFITILERKCRPLHPGMHMFTQPQFHALPAPQPKRLSRNTAPQSSPRYLADQEL